MAVDFSCNNALCRIRYFVGDYSPPLNSCPGCAMAGSPGAYYTPSVPTYTAPPAPIPPKGLEEAVAEDLSQILGEMLVEVDLASSTTMESTRKDIYREVRRWIEKKIPTTS